MVYPKSEIFSKYCDILLSIIITLNTIAYYSEKEQQLLLLVRRAITIGEKSRKEAKYNTNKKAKKDKRAIRNKRESQILLSQY